MCFDGLKNFKLVFSKYLSMNIFLIISYLSLFIWLYLSLLHGRSSILGGYFFWSNNIIFENFLKLKINNQWKNLCYHSC